MKIHHGIYLFLASLLSHNIFLQFQASKNMKNLVCSISKPWDAYFCYFAMWYVFLMFIVVSGLYVGAYFLVRLVIKKRRYRSDGVVE